jgi:hypothetical protein
VPLGALNFSINQSLCILDIIKNSASILIATPPSLWVTVTLRVDPSYKTAHCGEAFQLLSQIMR